MYFNNLCTNRGSSGQQLYCVGLQSGREGDVGKNKAGDETEVLAGEGGSLTCSTKYRVKPLRQRRQTCQP